MVDRGLSSARFELKTHSYELHSMRLRKQQLKDLINILVDLANTTDKAAEKTEDTYKREF